MSSPSSSSTFRWKYEVFLSFRGIDTRRGFTDHLYAALQRKGIFTFRDDEELERGKFISPELLKAIEESRFAIIIFSRNYAFSTRCLDELTKIVRCMREARLMIWPIFYDVDPSDVRKQTGTFGEAFNEHEKRFKENIKMVEMWRDALREVANLSGWHLQDRHESEFIQHIVKEIMKKLSSKSSSIIKNFIGIESTMAKFIPSYLGFENNVYMIGIYGMGGLGKTTLARVVYDEFCSHFESSSFIAKVREDSKKQGLLGLQKQLLKDTLENKIIHINNVYDGIEIIKERLCCRKVLLVIDDVDHLDQLEKLVGEHGWFGLGSWIIITTRDEHVLKQHGVLKRYNPNGLNNDDALKLFCLKAFKNEQPKKGYMQLSQEIVKYANGLPLALVTFGSFLVGRTIDEWQSALDSFKKTKGEVFDILKISYDGLEETWKDIFLDIACFFRQWEKDEVIQILENFGFDARIGVSVLLERSLLTMDDNKLLEMHDLLAEMGQKIIRFESGGNVEKLNRLWLTEDLFHVLKNDMATNAIEAIVVTYGEVDFNFEEFPEVFSKMYNLRLLIISKLHVQNALSLVPNDLRHLVVPNNLRYLSWSFCPLKCFPSSFKPKELVQIDLRQSKFEYLWKGVMRSVKLKFIDLSESENLIRTPDFSGVPRLEGLKLSFCSRLVEIHPSIGQLSKLRYLHLQNCKSLTDLPSMSAKMQSLTVINLDGCSKISSVPKFTGIMKSLLELYLGETAIKKLEPSSIECLTALTLLDLTDCENLECLPSNMENLKSLEKLILSRCSKLKSLPRLPSTVRFINAQCCSSLKWSPTLSRLSQPLFWWPPYDESGSGVAFTILYHHLQGLLFRKTVYGTSIERKEEGTITELKIIVSGFEIPSWLTHLSLGNSISIELPSNWCNSKWMGFALCASVSTSKWMELSVRACVTAIGCMPQNHYTTERFTSWMLCGNSIWLLYLSRDDWLATIGNGECNQIRVVFETDGSAIHVRECGVNLVYEQDVDEFSQTNGLCSIERIVGDDDDEDEDEEDDDDDDDDDYYFELLRILLSR
ncbi:hypothetical protein SO802_022960 [Lithocarpus litseifolius]|uniref:ADP-ribosyl cyclase/cyclic ADP-ribose hydrolase n=1 Tax=Lithocarpus litseifolius TaxID=425828 RepID=A0AAW2C797_9ROSI